MKKTSSKPKAGVVQFPAEGNLPNKPPLPYVGPEFVSEGTLLRQIPASRRTLQNWRANGKIPFIWIGRRVLYHVPSVREALLRLQKNAA